MASTNLDPSNFVDQMRLNTGDFIEDEPYLEDSIYVSLLEFKLLVNYDNANVCKCSVVSGSNIANQSLSINSGRVATGH